MGQAEGTDGNLLKGSLRGVWRVCRGGLALESEEGRCSRVLLFLRISRLIFNSPGNPVQKQAQEANLAGPGNAVSCAFGQCPLSGRPTLLWPSGTKEACCLKTSGNEGTKHFCISLG